MSHRWNQQSVDSGSSYYQVPNHGSTVAFNGAEDKHTYPAASAYGAGAGAGAGAAARSSRKWYQNPWVKFGVPVVLIAVIAGAVVGGVKGSQSSSKSSSSSGGISNAAAGSQAAVSKDANGNPVYGSATTSATAPAQTGTNQAAVCGSDNPTWNNQSGNALNVRVEHPRLFAPQYRWNCLQKLIPQDAYLQSWNATIMANATRYYNADPVQYIEDGGLSGSGVLDIARELQLRTKHWAYAWRMTNDSRWVDRTWRELVIAAGNDSSQAFGTRPDNWNTAHFLDLAEFTMAFAYAYDWMYGAWTQTQRDAIMWSIINLGLNYGYLSYTDPTAKGAYGWWQTTNGNWNCVCNKGLTLGAIAIAHEDPTGVAQRLLALTIPNARANCAQAVYTDGTWTETSDYWYFGATSHAELSAGLLSSSGSTQQLLTVNPNFNKTGLFHIYGTGFVEKFNYGDCGPNKYTATANSLMFYGQQYNTPVYTLYQRDRSDAPEPLSMFYYNTDVSGDWWLNLPYDHYFNDPHDAWASMRTSWTNSSGLYAAIKAGNNTGHQNHNNLDTGTFVIEALGQRWAGELCQDNYLSPGYFSGDAATGTNGQRWLYYRCRTEGQNTILYNGGNQNLNIAPPTTYGSTNDAQTSLNADIKNGSTAFFWTDLGAAYDANIRRGMRLINGRRQVLLQDELTNTAQASQWRMHTNATISYSNGNRVANLALGGQTMTVSLLASAPSLTFITASPTRAATDPALPSGGEEEPNTGVSVLAINIPAGTTNVQVLFNPQWPGVAASTYVTPASVPLSSWSLTSHP